MEESLKKLQEALVHIENNRRLAWRDFKVADGYEVFEYLKNIHTWMEGGLSDLTELAKSVGVTLPEPDFKTFDDISFEGDPFPSEGDFEEEDEEDEGE